VLQICPAGRRLRRQPIKQVHVLLDQAPMIGRFQLPRPNRQQRPADNGSRAQSEFSQTRHVNSSLYQILRMHRPSSEWWRPVAVSMTAECDDEPTSKGTFATGDDAEGNCAERVLQR
jgi:hypothetical protein